MAPKSDGSSQFWTDFVELNAVAVPDSFPLPHMEDCVDRIGLATFITKLDLLKGHRQVPPTPRSSPISSFVTPDHFPQYKVIALGMQNEPATFQRLMNTVVGAMCTEMMGLCNPLAGQSIWLF